MRGKKDITEFKEGMLEDRVVISPNGIAVFNKSDELGKHTEEIQEIITKVPAWIVRWGITLLFSTILIILAISILIPYPEMVKSPLKLQSLENTVSVVASTTGRIVKVFVGKNSVVKKGQPLIELQKEIGQEPYILKAPTAGKIGFSAIIQAGSIAGENKEMFKIHPLNEEFYGVMYIPKYAISKIKVGQEVLIKLGGNTSIGNNVVQGNVDFVADEPVNDHFLIKVAFTKPKIAGEFEVKSWMEFEAQIITKKSNLFSKIFGSLIDVYNTI